MAITQVLLMCLGLCLLAKNGAAAPDIPTTTVSVAENSATVTFTGSGTPTGVTLSAQTNEGQFTGAVTAGNLILTVATGYTLNYEVATSLSVTAVLTDGSTPVLTATVTLTITVTDVANEFSDTAMFLCVSGTSFAAASTVGTTAITSTATAVYSITAQTITGMLDIGAATGVLTVAAGKTLNGLITPTYSVTVQSVAGGVTSTSVVSIGFGCSSSGAAITTVIGSFTLLLALLVAMLQ